MKRRKFFGSQCIFLSSLILFILSAWEAAVRLDAMYKPLGMFFDMALGEGISFSSAMQYFDFSIFEAPLWLLLCMFTALTTVFFIRRPAGSAVTLPLSILLAAYGLMRESTFLTDVWRLIQPSLLLFNAFVIIMNLLIYPTRRRAEARSSAPAPDTPRLHDAPRLQRLSRQKHESRTRRSA